MYEYHYTDYQGNLRVAYREQASQTYTATFENANETQFALANAPIRNNEIGGSGTSSFAGKLVPSNPMGAWKSIPVKRGDKITVSAKARYQTNATSNNNIVWSTLFSLLSNATFGAVGEGNNVARLQAGLSIAPFLLPQNTNTNNQIPKAYLAYRFYDKNNALLYSEAKQVNESAKISWQSLQGETYAATQEGTFEVFVMNESNVAVWFDDIRIDYSPTRITQENHYDAWGLNLVGIEREGDLRFQYNAMTERESRLGIQFYETPFRSYDAQLGRFHQVDLLAGLYTGTSPYNYAFNNPITFNDPSGLSPECPCGNPSSVDPCPCANGGSSSATTLTPSSSSEDNGGGGTGFMPLGFWQMQWMLGNLGGGSSGSSEMGNTGAGGGGGGTGFDPTVVNTIRNITPYEVETYLLTTTITNKLFQRAILNQLTGRSIEDFTKHVNDWDYYADRRYKGAYGEALYAGSLGRGTLDYSSYRNGFEGMAVGLSQTLTIMQPTQYKGADILYAVTVKSNQRFLHGFDQPFGGGYIQAYEKGKYNFVYEVKTLGMNAYTYDNIIEGFKDIDKYTTGVNYNKVKIVPVLVIDRAAWNYALENADASQIQIIWSHYLKLKRNGGHLVLANGLNKDAESGLDEILYDIKQWFKK